MDEWTHKANKKNKKKKNEKNKGEKHEEKLVKAANDRFQDRRRQEIEKQKGKVNKLKEKNRPQTAATNKNDDQA